MSAVVVTKASIDASQPSSFSTVTLDDKYAVTHGRAFMNGTQALVRNLTAAEIVAQVQVAREDGAAAARAFASLPERW